MAELKFVIEKSPRIDRLIRHLYAKMPEIEKALGIPEGYTYTEVNG